MPNFALHEVLRNLRIHRRFIMVCLDEGVRGLGEGAWVPNLCPPVPAPSIHRSAWKGNSLKLISVGSPLRPQRPLPGLLMDTPPYVPDEFLGVAKRK
jgi:hypothetical protein